MARKDRAVDNAGTGLNSRQMTQRAIDRRRGSNPDALVPLDNNRWLFRGCELSRRGVDVPETFTRDDFFDLMGKIFQFSDMLNLWMGDLLVQGEIRAGLTYDQIAERFGKSGKTLANWKYTLERVPHSLRKEHSAWDRLSYSHYALVASMSEDDQIYWLNRAAVDEWAVTKLHNEIKGRKARATKWQTYKQKRLPDFVSYVSGLGDDRNAAIDEAIAELKRLRQNQEPPTLSE